MSRLTKHTKSRILDGYQRHTPLADPVKVSITKRYGVRIFDQSGIILAQMTLKRSEYYQNVSAWAERGL